MSTPYPGDAAGVLFLSITHGPDTPETSFTIHLHHRAHARADEFVGQRLVAYLDQDIDIRVQAMIVPGALSFGFQIQARAEASDPFVEQASQIREEGPMVPQVTSRIAAPGYDHTVHVLAWQIPLNTFSSLVPIDELPFLTIALLEGWGCRHKSNIYEYSDEYGDEDGDEDGDGDGDRDGGEDEGRGEDENMGDDEDRGEREEDEEEDGVGAGGSIIDDESMPDYDSDLEGHAGEAGYLQRELRRKGVSGYMASAA
ncbi:hypothetical protein MMC30_002226 [Trapelia coarctata]|nr:hypothetical protein [Trapelia coarctata]